MTYIHLTPTELVIIKAIFNHPQAVLKVANLLQRSRQTICNVYRFLKSGGNAMRTRNNKKNKCNCGGRPIVFLDEQ